jgi:hypothetical protein
MRRTRLSSYYCFVLVLAVKASSFRAKRYSGRLHYFDLMSYEGVRFIVLVVAVQRDRIHKKEHSQKLRRPIWALKNVLLTMKQLSLDTVHEMNL